MAKVNKGMDVLIGNEVKQFLNGSQMTFTRPFDRGYLNNWACEMEVWLYLLNSKHMNVKDPSECSLVMTEAPFSPEALQNDTNEVVFEGLNFREYTRRPAASFSAYEYGRNAGVSYGGAEIHYSRESSDSVPTAPRSCCTVVDSGFSFTHAFPVIDNMVQKESVKRVNVGGKLLTNYLKELVSYRQWNMMDETNIMEDVKEKLSYITNDYYNELQSSLRGKKDRSFVAEDPFGRRLRQLYVLPDFHHILKGFVKPEGSAADANEQILSMETERFSVPELLFRPSDVGINQAGMAEATWQALQSLPHPQRALAASTILLTGGNCNIPHLAGRFFSEVAPFIPEEMPVCVYRPQEPHLYALRGAHRFVSDGCAAGVIGECMVTREEYLESGHLRCNSAFDAMW